MTIDNKISTYSCDYTHYYIQTLNRDNALLLKINRPRHKTYNKIQKSEKNIDC